MIGKQDLLVNRLIYSHPEREPPSRYEVVRYSSWRVHMFQELEAYMTTDRQKLLNSNFPSLFKTLFEGENQEFYQYMISPNYSNDDPDAARKDSISHFIGRMLYSQNPRNRQDFVNFEKIVLEIRLNHLKSSGKIMRILKKMLSGILNLNESFNVPEEDWADPELRRKILQGSVCDPQERRKFTSAEYAKLPFEIGEAGIRRRRCFIHRGFIYVHPDIMSDVVTWHYMDFLKAKLQKTAVEMAAVLEDDRENQLSTFLLTALNTMNQASLQQIEMEAGQKLTLKNVQVLWHKYFPPCMMSLTQRLKEKSHLKHDGRRQLWLYFKSCGMTSFDNQEFFRRNMAHKVSDSDMKSHIYNIQHAYGEVGKRQAFNGKTCRNIITGAAPKGDEFHGCPFKHWSSDQLKPYLSRNYRISQDDLFKIISEKQENHFQPACGKLFEATQINQRLTSIPQDVLALLGKSPQSYFQAGMEINKRVSKKNDQSKDTLEF